MTDVAADRARLQGLLAALEQRTPERRIELGLDRVAAVFERLAPDLSDTRIVSIAGTNGKGSTVAFLESLAHSSGRSCLAYTSPHVAEFAERIRLNGQALADGPIADALERVERLRGDVPLTWFEQVTLAALVIAGDLRPDWLLAEVGLGGRLDAVNVLDADVAVITSIGLDHQQFLGRTRAAIAREKCGIARARRPVVVAERRPPPGMRARLDEIGAQVLAAGEAFDWRWRGEALTLRIDDQVLYGLRPGLAGRHQGGNAAAAVVTARSLAPDLDADTIGRALAATHLVGRFQTLAECPRVIVDVAHNPAAARVLARQLGRLSVPPLVVFAALADKDIAGMVRALLAVTDRWFVAGLDGPRGLDAEALRTRMPRLPAGRGLEALESVAEALARARRVAAPGQAVVVFGSFHTVAKAIACCKPLRE
ncbi:MAG: folylpolyglutamate synthase/dihydrofolate synthase family protein [Wenzhouxiangellaceae bacterium]|nr:folylpolyglutamate synthase/dihydrofolate synthase family protein [Wenzhouxiangellaceae bacterium]